MTKVMIAGYFDPIHPGHLETFKFARLLAPDAHIIVVIHSTEDIVKKSGFYIYEPHELGKLLIGFKDLIDEVLVSIDTDGTVTQTLKLIKPNIFVKGPDRTPENMPPSELEVCKAIGCQIVYQIGDKAGASSKIKERIKAQFNKLSK